MKRSAVSVVVLVLGALLIDAAPALGQQRDTVRADSTRRPFVRGGVYDKPFQVELFGRTAIGGYAEVHARYERVDGVRDELGFDAKRFNIFTSTRVSDFIRIASEIEFEEGGRDLKLEYAAIDFRIHPSLSLRGGMLLSPLGKFNLSHDSPLNEFTDRPVVATELLGVALSEPGFGVLGQLGYARSGRLTYELYATNGFHDGLINEAEEGTRVALGRGNLEDNNGSPAVVGRLAVSPALGHELGFSGHHGAYNVFDLEGTSIDRRRNLSIAVVDFESELLGTQLNGEAALVRIDVPASLSGIYASSQRGLYVDAIREFGRAWVKTMPNSSFALKMRLDLVDFDTDVSGSSSGQITIGLNFRPTRDSVLKIDFVRGRSRDRFNNLAEHASVLWSLATYF